MNTSRTMDPENFDSLWGDEPTKHDIASDLVSGRVGPSDEVIVTASIPVHPAEVEPCPFVGSRPTVEVPCVCLEDEANVGGGK